MYQAGQVDYISQSLFAVDFQLEGLTRDIFTQDLEGKREAEAILFCLMGSLGQVLFLQPTRVALSAGSSHLLRAVWA